MRILIPQKNISFDTKMVVTLVTFNPPPVTDAMRDTKYKHFVLNLVLS